MHNAESARGSRAANQGTQNGDQGSKTNDGNNAPLSRVQKELRKLQAELCQLQEWVKHKGLRVIIVFEGRDAAGKGGTIHAITERVSPRVFRLVALPAPRSREVADVHAALHGSTFPRRARS